MTTHPRFAFRAVPVLFVFFLALSARGQQPARVAVSVGDIPPGMQHFSVVSFADYISLTPHFLGEANTTGQTAFKLEITPDTVPSWVRVVGPGISKDLIVERGKSYSFAVKPDGETYYLERLNTGLAPDDPNVLCDSVNVLVNGYLYKYNTLLFSGGMAKRTYAYCDSVAKIFAGAKSPLFTVYLNTRLDELRMLSGAWSEAAMFKLRLGAQPFSPENPDYAYAFGEFYKGRLEQILLKNKMAHGKDLIHRFRGMDTLTKLLATEKFYPRGEVGEGALLLGLTELMQNRDYSQDAILYLFNQISDSSDYAPVRRLAARLYKKYKMPVAGEQAPELTVMDKTDKEHMPMRGDRSAYVCFMDPKSQVTATELAALTELKKKLKEKYTLWPVIVNAEKSELARMQVSQRLTYELFRNVDSNVLTAYRLKNDCTCMVLSPSGTFVMPVAPPPSTPLLAEKLLELSKTIR